jgi:hypothetical protein
MAREPAITAVPVEDTSLEPVPDAAASAAESSEAPAGEFRLDTPVVVPLPRVVQVAAPATAAAGHVDTHGEEDEPDPSEVRRHIAAASRNLDPDYQIRRAMDAFLSPTRPNGD